MGSWIQAAARISNQWSLAAFAIAAILAIVFVVLKTRKKETSSVVWVAITALVIVGVLPMLASAYLERARIMDPNRAIYHVRTIVLGPADTPVDDAKVWSSASGEPKKIAGGWQLDIPNGSKPSDGKFTIYASIESAFLMGKSEVHLGTDLNPTVTIHLRADTGASLRGIVVDDSGNGVSGARVVVVGYEKEGIVTGVDGSFSLPAHAASGQMVRVHVQMNGYGAANQDCPAGDSPTTIVVTKK